MSFVAEPIEYLDEARRYGEKVSARARPLVQRAVRKAEHRSPLRVGLVSGDLRNHPVAAFLESILANLDRSKVEIHAYTTTRHDDEVTARIRGHCSSWFSIAGMSDEAAARRIQDDGIDVLIDLAGHTGHNRLTVFAWRPAPVQVTWLGYLASTGLASMDYVLADRASVPEDQQWQFVEKVWYMPNSLYCFTPPAVAPPVGPLPAVASGGVTFGSFQRMNKISDESLEAWARILEGVSGARLRLQCKQLGDAQLRAGFVERLRHFGIPIERVELVGPVPDRVAYLAGHAQVDIVLDTFPYPGITTTCEALWMGVPTVTLAGNTLLSRQGASLLSCVDLDDWIAENKADYIERAISHAADLESLSRLRAGLRERARASPLFDAPRFARDFEAALWQMCERAAVDGTAHTAIAAFADDTRALT
jgi:predicted O-linked N-acetylglucosamine transferase (SPINDLY family)